MNSFRLPLLIGPVLLVLVGCGASSDGSTTATTGAAVTTTTVAAATSTVPSTSPPVTTTPPPSAPPATEPVATAAPAIGQCATSALALTLGDTDGAMGSIYTPLVFTNTGTVTCTLDGHPGVSFIDGAGNQVGPSAERTDATTPTVAIAPGEQAHAILQTHDALFYSDECAPVSAGRMKVYPPDQTEALTIDYPFDVCTGTISGAQFVIDVVSPGSSA